LPEIHSKNRRRHAKQKIQQTIRQDIANPNRRRIAFSRLENLLKFSSFNSIVASSTGAAADTPSEMQQQNLIVELMARQGSEFRFDLFLLFAIFVPCGDSRVHFKGNTKFSFPVDALAIAHY
jgi:hypothetical protein